MANKEFNFNAWFNNPVAARLRDGEYTATLKAWELGQTEQGSNLKLTMDVHTATDIRTINRVYFDYGACVAVTQLMNQLNLKQCENVSTALDHMMGKSVQLYIETTSAVNRTGQLKTYTNYNFAPSEPVTASALTEADIETALR